MASYLPIFLKNADETSAVFHLVRITSFIKNQKILYHFGVKRDKQESIGTVRLGFQKFSGQSQDMVSYLPISLENADETSAFY